MAHNVRVLRVQVLSATLFMVSEPLNQESRIIKMKVIIPAAGYGTRMRPHTHTRPKPLVPVAGRPSLAFVLDALAPLDIEELIFIVGRMGNQMEDYVKENYPYKSTFIEQKVMRGQADAIALAREHVQGDLMTLFVDTLFEADLIVINTLDV